MKCLVLVLLFICSEAFAQRDLYGKLDSLIYKKYTKYLEEQEDMKRVLVAMMVLWGIPEATAQQVLVGYRPSTVIIPTPAGAPSVPTLSSPTDGVDSVDVAPTFVWSKSDSADTYTLQFDQDSTFASVEGSFVQTDTFKVMSGLDSGAIYYWRVKATNTVGSSAWSDTSSFTTITALPPAAPILVSPANASDSAGIEPLLTWTSVATATQYELQISLSTLFIPTLTDSTLTGTSATLDTLTNSTTYYWRVRAYNPSGYSPWTATWSFVVIPTADVTRPGPITTLAVYGATTTSVSLEWTAVGDDSLTGTASSYDVRYSTDSSIGWTSWTAATGEPTPKAVGLSESFIVTGLAGNTLYYFSLKASDEAGNISAVSNIVDTTTSTTGGGDTTHVWAGDYHIKPDGSDIASGASFAYAWRTFSKANSVLVAGDTLVVHSGTYTDKIAPAYSGSSGSPIVIANYGTDVCSLYTANNCLTITDVDYVIVQGLRMQMAVTGGSHVVLVDNSDHWMIKNCYIYGGSTYNTVIYGTGQTVYVTESNYGRFIGNTVDRQDADITDDSYRGDGVVLHVNGTCNIFEGNTVHNVSHYGMFIPNNVYQPITRSYNIVRTNTIYDCHVGYGPGGWNMGGLFDGNTVWSCGVVDDYRNGQPVELIGQRNIVRYEKIYDDTLAIAGTSSIMNFGVMNNDADEWGVTSDNRIYGCAFLGASRNTSRRNSYGNIAETDTVHGRFGHTVLKNNIIAYPTNYQKATPYFFQNNRYGDGMTTADTISGCLLWNRHPGDSLFCYQDATWYTLSQAEAAIPQFVIPGTNIEEPPGFVDSLSQRGARSFITSALSPCRDAGVALTVVATTAASGQKVIHVGDASYFHYDWTPYDGGDSLYIDGERVLLDSVDYVNNNLICKSNLVSTHAAGVGVHVLATYSTQTGLYTNRLSGTGPDIGPYE